MASDDATATTPETTVTPPAEEATEVPTEEVSKKPTAKPSKTKASEPLPPAVKCQRRKGNPGEIVVWSSYGSDQPPDAMRLGAGYVWNFGDKKCTTPAQVALDTVPPLPGFCVEVGTVAANPGYRVNARPAARLKSIIGQSGDC